MWLQTLKEAVFNTTQPLATETDRCREAGTSKTLHIPTSEQLRF